MGMRIDVLEGGKIAALALRARGHQATAIRLDSGDLAYLSIEARRILDAAGLPEVKILASNDLDEHLIAARSSERRSLFGPYSLFWVTNGGHSFEGNMRHQRLAITAILFSFAALGVVHAQAPTRISLDQAIDLAIAHNHALKATQTQIQQSQAQEITAALSRIHGLFVCARHSASAYRGVPKDARAIAGELGVRYLVEGAISRNDNALRCNVRLIDGRSGLHIWADRVEAAAGAHRELRDRIGAILRMLGGKEPAAA